MPNVSNPAGYYAPAAPTVSDDGASFWFPENPSLVFDASQGVPGQDPSVYQASRSWFNGGDSARLAAGEYGILHLTGWNVFVPNLGIPGTDLNVSSLMMGGTFGDVMNALWSVRGGTLLGMIIYEYRAQQSGPDGLGYEIAFITRTDPGAQPMAVQPMHFVTYGQPDTAGGTSTGNILIAGLPAATFIGTVVGLIALAPETVGLTGAIAAGLVAAAAVDLVTGGRFLTMLKGVYKTFIQGIGDIAAEPAKVGGQFLLYAAVGSVALAWFLGKQEDKGTHFDFEGVRSVLGTANPIASQATQSAADILHTELEVGGGALGAARANAQQRNRGVSAVTLEQARAETARIKGESAVEIARLKAGQRSGHP